MGTLIKRSLSQNEDIIEAGVKSFLDVGNALIDIRDGKQYAGKFDTFEEYCQKRWGFSRPRAYQYIESATAVADLSTIVDKKIDDSNGKTSIPAPENEAQARAVAESAPDPRTRQKVWQQAVASAPKDATGAPRITAAIVKKAAEVVGATKPQAAKSEENWTAPDELPEIEPLIDGMDGPLPPSLEKTFEAVGELTKLGRQLAGILNEIRELHQDHPGGKAIPLQEIESNFTALKSALKFAKPFTECTKCKRKLQKSCQMCKGHGWVTSQVWSRNRTETDEKWLKSRN